MKWFDAHFHLADSRLNNVRSDFARAACANGVVAGLSCAAFPNEWETSLEAPFQLHQALGLHPWAAAEATPELWAHLRERLAQNEALLVGEIGFDGLRPTLDGGAQQLHAFRAQLDLAVTFGRAVVIHGAKAWAATFDVLVEYAPRLPAIMLHGASFSVEMLRHPLFKHPHIWVSIGGTIANPKARTARQLATTIPHNRLLIETDAPDGLPFEVPSLPGSVPSLRLNHPGNLSYIGATLAALRGCSQTEIAAITSENARTFIHQSRL